MSNFLLIDKREKKLRWSANMVTTLATFELSGWMGFGISGRVDAFNDRQLIQSLSSLMRQNSQIALDLSQAEFLSLQVLTFLSSQNRLLKKSGGEIALIRPSHNVRRQIEIFLGPRIFRIFESREDLRQGSSFEPRAEFHSQLSDQLSEQTTL